MSNKGIVSAGSISLNDRFKLGCLSGVVEKLGEKKYAGNSLTAECIGFSRVGAC